MAVRILIVDDHEVVRQGVRTIIERAKRDWEICGEAANGQQAISLAAQLRPDVIVLDLTMPGVSGFDAAARIFELGVRSAILIFTMHESDQLADDARRVGASGFVAKSDAVRHLVVAIETIISGGTFFGRPERPKNSPEGNPGSGMLFRLALSFS